MCVVVPLIESLLIDQVCPNLFVIFLDDVEDEVDENEVFADDNVLLADFCNASEADDVRFAAGLVVRTFSGDDAKSLAGLF
jgi:hypothetical protein